MILVLERNEDVIGTIGAIICGVQMIPMIGCIVSTERALNHYYFHYDYRVYKDQK